MFDDVEMLYETEGPRYTVVYKGYLFVDDSDGWNFHDYDDFRDAIGLYYAYGDMISIQDNWYGVTFEKGEWI